MITDPHSSLMETKSNRKESSFPAEWERLISSRLQYLENLLICTTGTPRLECVLTNMINYENCQLPTANILRHNNLFPTQMMSEKKLRRNSILMKCHNPDLGCALENFPQPVRITIKIWSATSHKYWIFLLVLHMSFRSDTSGGIIQNWRHSQVTKLQLKLLLSLKFKFSYQ